MPGILTERVKVVRLFTPESRTTTGILFNDNAAASDTTVGVDTRDYDEITYVLELGTFAAGASVAFAVYEYATDDSSNATAITGASFGTITSASDDTTKTGHVNCKETTRYHYLRSNKITNTNAAVFSAIALLSRADMEPVSSPTPTFTV